MKFPLVSSFCIATVIFGTSTYVAYKGALQINYRYRESRAFSSLGKEDAQQLRVTLAILSALSFSHLWTRYEPSPGHYHKAIERNIPALRKIRNTAPEQLRPPIDLQMAIDYAEMARLEQRAGNVAQANRARLSAQGLLSSLGWKDVSEDALNSLADQELKPLRKSGGKE